jgi:hypothetical protein
VDLSWDGSATQGTFDPGLSRHKGKVGFQAQRGTIRFRKIEIKELPTKPVPPTRAPPVKPTNEEKPPVGDPRPTEGFVSLFNGKDLDGWYLECEAAGKFVVKDGVIVGTSPSTPMQNYLLSKKEYSDYILRFECLVEAGGNAGVALRAVDGETTQMPGGKVIPFHPLLKLTDPIAPIEADSRARTGTTRVVDGRRFTQPSKRADFRVGEWTFVEMEVKGRTCRIWIKRKLVANLKWDGTTEGPISPGLSRAKGKVGLHAQVGTARFRKIEIKELP